MLISQGQPPPQKKARPHDFSKGSSCEGDAAILFIPMLNVFCSSFFCSSNSRRACRPRKGKMNMVTASVQTPLNMIARCMFCGGTSAGEARRASCTSRGEAEKKEKGFQQRRARKKKRRGLPNIKTMQNRFPLKQSQRKIRSLVGPFREEIRARTRTIISQSFRQGS